jgi:NitT/TauT family transport system substrate-binding protein
MTIKDVEPVLMAAADAGAALIAGRVAVAVTYEPHISAALGGNSDYGLLYTAAEKPGLISDVMIARHEFIQKNPQVLRALALAWDDAITFLRQKPDEGGKIIADAVGSPMEEFKVAWAGVQVFDLKENREQMSGPFRETFTTVGSILKGLKPDEIKEVPDPAKVFVADFLAER